MSNALTLSKVVNKSMNLKKSSTSCWMILWRRLMWVWYLTVVLLPLFCGLPTYGPSLIGFFGGGWPKMEDARQGTRYRSKYKIHILITILGCPTIGHTEFIIQRQTCHSFSQGSSVLSGRTCMKSLAPFLSILANQFTWNTGGFSGVCTSSDETNIRRMKPSNFGTDQHGAWLKSRRVGLKG